MTIAASWTSATAAPRGTPRRSSAAAGRESADATRTAMKTRMRTCSSWTRMRRPATASAARINPSAIGFARSNVDSPRRRSRRLRVCDVCCRGLTSWASVCGGAGPPAHVGIYAVAPVRVLGSRFMMRSPPIATTSSVMPLTSENAAIRASRTSAPSPGFANITRPNRIGDEPAQGHQHGVAAWDWKPEGARMAITPNAIA